MSKKIYNVTSPLAGTFYKAPSPEDEPFAAVGKHVKKNSIICIIESMKVFTELRSDYSGTVKSILLEDEAIVAKDQPLIEIELD